MRSRNAASVSGVNLLKNPAIQRGQAQSISSEMAVHTAHATSHQPTPLGAAWSRRHEFQADAFAARFSDGPELGRALVSLYRENASTLTPDPLHSAFYDSHPPPVVRISRLVNPGSAQGSLASRPAFSST